MIRHTRTSTLVHWLRRRCEWLHGPQISGTIYKYIYTCTLTAKEVWVTSRTSNIWYDIHKYIYTCTPTVKEVRVSRTPRYLVRHTSISTRIHWLLKRSPVTSRTLNIWYDIQEHLRLYTDCGGGQSDFTNLKYLVRRHTRTTTRVHWLLRGSEWLHGPQISGTIYTSTSTRVHWLLRRCEWLHEP